MSSLLRFTSFVVVHLSLLFLLQDIFTDSHSAATAATSQKEETETWTRIPLPKKQLRTEDIKALNRFNLNRWAEREHTKHRSVNNYRKVVAQRSAAYNASIHWKDVRMPTQSYW